MDVIVAGTDCKYHFAGPVLDNQGLPALVWKKGHLLASSLFFAVVVGAGPELVEDIGCSHSVAQE